MQDIQNTATWPTTFGSICVVVGGLTLFGSCLSLSGMAEIEQLHTAIPFGEGEIGDALRGQLQETAPMSWVATLLSCLNILFSIVLTIAGMGLLQHAPKARVALLWWAGLYILLNIVGVIIHWVPRWELVQEHAEVQGMFLAQLVISTPLYLILPVFLLFFLNKNRIRSEVESWR